MILEWEKNPNGSAMPAPLMDAAGWEPACKDN